MTDARTVISRVAQRIGVSEALVQRVAETFCDELSWQELHPYFDELRKGQSIYEDAGGYFLRCIKRLFGIRTDDEEILTYRKAMAELVKAASEGK